MNLTTDPWIPIVWANGQPGTVSLGDAFARGEDIRDLAVRPHERIALMRLLICIAQAALDGPTDHDELESVPSQDYAGRTQLPEAVAEGFRVVRRWAAFLTGRGFEEA